MSIGLALSGGAVLGTAHIGVMKALAEAQIPCTMVSGTSAGSLVGGIYASGRSLKEMEDAALSLTDNMLDFNSSGAAKALVGSVFGRRSSFSGFFKGNEVFKLAYRMTGGMYIREAPIMVALSAVDVNSGNTVFFTNVDIPSVKGDYVVKNNILMAEAITASCTIPAVFVPRRVGEMTLVDGGVTEYVPVKVLRDMGADYVIAVDLGRAAGVRKKPDDMLEIVGQSYEIMARRLAENSLTHADTVIAPYVSDIGLFEFKRIPELIERGYNAARRMIPTIKMQMIRAGSRRVAT